MKITGDVMDNLSEKYLDYFVKFNKPTKEKYKITAASYKTS